MGLDRRVVVALSVIAMILVPAAVLRALCIGHSCDEVDDAVTNIPFCSLPPAERRAVIAGFREGRSPDVVAIEDSADTERVPVVFFGPSFDGVTIPPGMSLDQVAPTVADAIGFARPHPDVRSGESISGVGPQDGARLVLLVALKGVDSSALAPAEWTALTEGSDAATTDAVTGSWPADAAALTTTIGTGGIPAQHGITGRLIRDDSGRLVRAWGTGAPVSVIATLADHLDEASGNQARISLVAGSALDRGLIGGNWYIGGDRDDIRVAARPKEQLGRVRGLLESGYGGDDVVDVIAVAVGAREINVVSYVSRIVNSARRASGGRFVAAVAGTGSGDNERVNTSAIEQAIPGPRNIIDGVVEGGFFIDHRALADTGLTEDQVIAAVQDTASFTDVFAGITVSFARYC